MDSVDRARATQLKNIQYKTGKSLDEIRNLIQESGLQRHSEIRQMLIDHFGLGFGDATMLVHFALQSDGQSAAEATHSTNEEILAGIYTGSKACLRPLHEKVMGNIAKFGEYSVTPKKGYLSLRRKRQFATIGPGTKGRLEIGLNMKDVPPTERLIEQKGVSICQYKIFVTSEQDIDRELLGYLKTAYETSA